MSKRLQPALVPTRRTLSAATTCLLTLALIVAACGSTQPGATAQPGASPAAAELECEVQGFPCSLAEVPADIFVRSDALGDEALGRLETGKSTSDVAAWLVDQEGMADVESDDSAIQFRLEGGRGTWIIRSDALGSRGSVGTAGSPDQVGRSVVPPPPREPAADPGAVVQEAVDQKSAVVLSPFLWDFKKTDDGAEVTAILAGTRGYEGRVTNPANDSSTATAVNVESFKHWGNNQVIHVVSHGFRLCEQSPCRAVIAASTLQGQVPAGTGIITEATRLELTDRGVVLGKVEDPCTRGLQLDPCGRVALVLLTADFFIAEYPGGLSDSVVFFNACEVFGTEATDLADAIRRGTSVFLGWNETVDTVAAHDAAIALYTDLSGKGYPVEEAYARLGALQTDPRGARLILGKRQAGGDLRIREVVTLLEPVSGQPLGAASGVAIEGELGDGEPDAAPYRVRVDGITPEQASGVFLHVSVDGDEGEPQALSSGRPNELDQWEVSGRVPLSFDLEEDTPVTFRAWVDLPSKGQSDHETPATLTGAGPIMGRVWELDVSWSRLPLVEPGDTAAAESATGHFVLTFADRQDVDEPHPTYEVTSGSITYDRSHADSACIVTAPSVTFDVTNAEASHAYLAFDTTSNPVEYSIFLDTDGPQLDALYTCRGGRGPCCGGDTYDEEIPRTIDADLLWFTIGRDEHRTVSADGRTISGMWRKANTVSPGAIREATYTITRIE